MIENAVIVGLSSFMITFLLVENLDGPYGVLKYMRDSFTETDEEGNYKDNIMGPMFKCHWCLGTWVSLIISIIYMTGISLTMDYSFGTTLFEWLFVYLSSMAISGTIHEFVMSL